MSSRCPKSNLELGRTGPLAWPTRQPGSSGPVAMHIAFPLPSRAQEPRNTRYQPGPTDDRNPKILSGRTRCHEPRTPWDSILDDTAALHCKGHWYLETATSRPKVSWAKRLPECHLSQLTLSPWGNTNRAKCAGDPSGKISSALNLTTSRPQGVLRLQTNQLIEHMGCEIKMTKTQR